MTDEGHTRRGVLAASAAGLTALAGCAGSDLPIIGDDDPTLEFDPAKLDGTVPDNRLALPSTYPGAVPESLATDHERRARELLADVPPSPSFPNGVVSARLRDQRDRTAEQLAEPLADTSPLERLGAWRYRRASAAEVRGAYRAARGELSAAALQSRRNELRDELAAFWSPWPYQGVDIVEAVAVHEALERLAEECHRYLDPHQSFPRRPAAAVFEVGELVADLERARATLNDLQGLWQVYRETTAELTAYRDPLSIATDRLDLLTQMSRRQVRPYLREGARPEDFQREVSGLPAERLFVDARRIASHWFDEAEQLRQRRNYAQAIVANGRALVSILALATVAEAIKEGKYGLPDSAEAVKEFRSEARSAIERIRSVSPPQVGLLVGTPAWTAFRQGEYSLGGPVDRERYEEPTDQSDVVRAVASYVLARHVAKSVPTVTERLAESLSMASK